MYKGVWTRLYLESLSRQVDYAVYAQRDWVHNVAPQDDGLLSDAVCAPPRYVEGRPREGTPLARRNFFLSGKVYSRERLPAEARCLYTPNSTVNTYRSFLVQSVDISESVRAILIDSSNLDERLSPGRVLSAAGSRGKITDEQMSEILVHAENARLRNQKIAIFAHNPFVDLPRAQQAALMSLQPIAYISGHTHFESSVIEHGKHDSRLLELNVGSTTDWPMEAMMVSLKSSSLHWRVFGARSQNEMEQAAQQTACGYEQVLGLPTEDTCRKYARTDYLSHVNKGGLTLSHGLCSLQSELRRLAQTWNLPVPPALRSAVDGDWTKTSDDWSKPAEQLGQIVNSWRMIALTPGTERELGLCQAVAASRTAGTQYRGLADKNPERSKHARPAALFGAALQIAH